MKSIIFGAAVVLSATAAQAVTNDVAFGPTVTVNGVTFTTNNGNAVAGTQYGQENTGGGSTSVSNGTLTVTGDRSRYVIGSLYDYSGAPSLRLSDLQSVTWDWKNNTTGTGQAHAAPVGRVIVADKGGARTELIWEYVYNGGANGVAAPLGTTQSVGSGALWYANVRDPSTPAPGPYDTTLPLAAFKANSQADTTGFSIAADARGRGVLLSGGSQINQQLTDWTQYFSADARVIGFSFGAGSGFGTYSGDVSGVAVSAAVPEPATWGMMMLGFGLVGAAMRRRRRTAVAA